MARTRGTADQATPKLPSDREVAASGKIASAAKSKKSKKNNTAAQPRKVRNHEKRDSDAVADIQKGKKNHLDEDSNGEQDFDNVESEEYDSEDYYPTKIAKKRDSQKLDAGENKPAINKTSQPAQKQLINEISHQNKNHKSAKSSLPSSSEPPAATKIICVACHDAHAKCGKSDVPDQPCDRCARLGFECVFDPNYKRSGRRSSLGKMGKDKKRNTGQQPKEEEDIGDISSEDPLNSPAPTIHVASRQTKTKARPANDRFSKGSCAKDHSPSSSALSSAPEDREDELEIAMAGAKDQTAENVDVPSTAKFRNKARAPRSAARKGPSPGIPAPNSNEHTTRLDKHDLSSSMTNPVPQQDPKLDGSKTLSGTTPVSLESQDENKEQENSCDDTAIDSASNPGSASHSHSVSPPPNILPVDQPAKVFTLASPRTKKNTPTFLPEGHGSVLNTDMVPEQQQQHPSPLPPISQLGPGGAYRGRYDTTTIPQPTDSTSPSQNVQVPLMTSSQILPDPPAIITNNHHALLSTTQANTNSNTSSSSPSSSSHPSYMAPEGSRVYRYSATKILFLLKHSQRAQFLAVGGVHLAPDAIARLTHEMEDARTRAVRLWYEVHDGLAVGEEMYDEVGLRFLEEFGRSN